MYQLIVHYGIITPLVLRIIILVAAPKNKPARQSVGWCDDDDTCAIYSIFPNLPWRITVVTPSLCRTGPLLPDILLSLWTRANRALGCPWQTQEKVASSSRKMAKSQRTAIRFLVVFILNCVIVKFIWALMYIMIRSNSVETVKFKL